MKVLAEINTDSPTGKRIVRVLEKHYKVVKLNYPSPTNPEEDGEKTFSFKEFKTNVKEEFKNRYGVEFDSLTHNEATFYDPKFVAKIKRSEKHAAKGKVQRVDMNELWLIEEL